VSSTDGVRVPTLVGPFVRQRNCPTEVGTLTLAAKVRHYAAFRDPSNAIPLRPFLYSTRPACDLHPEDNPFPFDLSAWERRAQKLRLRGRPPNFPDSKSKRLKLFSRELFSHRPPRHVSQPLSPVARLILHIRNVRTATPGKQRPGHRHSGKPPAAMG